MSSDQELLVTSVFWDCQVDIHFILKDFSLIEKTFNRHVTQGSLEGPLKNNLSIK